MATIDIEQVPEPGANQVQCGRLTGVSAHERGAGQAKLIEVCQGVCVVIQIRSIKSGGITRRFKRRNAINLARNRFKLSAQGDQGDGLAANYTNLEEILRLEFLH